MRAYEAFDLLGGESIKIMCFLYISLVQIFCIVMAKSASEEFVALFALFHASSLVMSASMLHHLVLLLSIFGSLDFFLFHRRLRWLYFLLLHLFFALFALCYLVFTSLLVFVVLFLILPLLLVIFSSIILLLLLLWIISLSWLLILLIVGVSLTFLVVVIYISNFRLIGCLTSLESRKVKSRSRDYITHWLLLFLLFN